jgi:succinyl-CoA synthetase beta subunit
MKIHEYQAKEVLKRFGVPVPRFGVAETPDEAYELARQLGTAVVVIKAQVHAGGRGKGTVVGAPEKLGGVKVVKDVHKVRDIARAMLGNRLVTIQTGAEGVLIRKLLVEEGLDIAKELYAAVTLDRAKGLPVLMASAEGGMDIEEVAHKHPEKIHRETIEPAFGLQGFQARRLGYRLGIDKGLVGKKFVPLIQGLVRAYLETDASMAEINPLVILKSGDMLALDAKLNFDENALFRQKAIAELRDPGEEDPTEIEAKKHDLSYISLDGSVGCLVNGAGLAMATMDIIKYAGGSPANFLDVGGGATQERVTAAFRIILRDPKVKAILVNIFGGIMKCDIIANGVVAAARELGLKVPLVVRLEGTNVEQGKAILRSSGLNITEASNMKDAAEKVVAAARGAVTAGVGA